MHSLEVTRLWLSLCNSASPCCAAWRQKVERSAHVREEQLASEPKYEKSKRWNNPDGSKTVFNFDTIEPEWSCEARERIPNEFGDGPKWACGIDALQRHKHCLVYSFGSNADVSFESAVKKRVPDCEIYTFDPTMNPKQVRSVVQKAEQSQILRFVAVGIAARDGNFTFEKHGVTRSYPGLSLPSIKKMLGHTARVVNIFKIDVEGSENDVFDSLSEADIGQMGQLLIEIHSSRPMAKALVERVRGSGLKLFNKEPNVWGCRGYLCAEFSFVGPHQAFHAFQATHPSCAHSHHGAGTLLKARNGEREGTKTNTSA